MDFGKRLKARRVELGISAEEIGKKIGKNRATIYRYEKGSIENVPLDILEPLAEALDTTPEYLMGRETPNIIQIGNKTIDVTKLKDWVEIFGRVHTRYRPALMRAGLIFARRLYHDGVVLITPS